MTLVSVLLAALLAFAATNVDDFFLLLVVIAQKGRWRTVVLGQYLGFAAILVASLLVALAAVAIPERFIGLLGVAPIAIGVKKLLERPSTRASRAEASHVTALEIAAVTLANGADNVAVYGPLFSSESWIERAVTIVTFLVLVLVWCVGARRVSRLRPLQGALDRWGHRLAPWVLIALGAYLVLHAVLPRIRG